MPPAPQARSTVSSGPVRTPQGTACAGAVPSRIRRRMQELAPLCLDARPQEAKLWNGEGRLALEILQTVADLNRDAPFEGPNNEERWLGAPAAAETLPRMVHRLNAVCGRSWPNVLYVLDRVTRHAMIPYTPHTAVKLLGAAAGLVCSCEGGAVQAAVAAAARVPQHALAGLCDALFRWLVAAHGAAEPLWDELVGYDDMGALRGDVKRAARYLQRAYAQRQALEKGTVTTPESGTHDAHDARTSPDDGAAAPPHALYRLASLGSCTSTCGNTSTASLLTASPAAAAVVPVLPAAAAGVREGWASFRTARRASGLSERSQQSPRSLDGTGAFGALRSSPRARRVFSGNLSTALRPRRRRCSDSVQSLDSADDVAAAPFTPRRGPLHRMSTIYAPADHSVYNRTYSIDL
eukprot:TRINITY_DN32739_c0_g1_i1.p1 TRINITY_DN32739_c0_g1~~TRINITY_DN32739_c0_g1_i1.p1  ORF type:complete len:425 (+),score=134.41 TRINITY_DN32739_c0_g1_i1:52-1275(+)